jgi:hypothetical protein
MKMKNCALLACIFLLFFTSSIAQVRERGGSSNSYSSSTEFSEDEFVSGSNAVPVKEAGISYYPQTRLMYYAEVLKLYAKSNGYDTAYAFLVNMGMRSSTRRFFIVNLSSMCVEKSGLVAHGRGDEKFTFNRQYSNNSGSNCTSLGKYKIGKSYKGFFGLAYKMHGLDETNNKAYERNVVMHGMHCVPETENGRPICQSDGCPAVSDRFILELKRVIDNRKKPVLMWIFDSTRPAVKKSAAKKKAIVSKNK